MKCILLLLPLIGCAFGAPDISLDFINRVLTKIVDDEVQQVGACMREILECKGADQYPDCLDSDGILKDKVDVDVARFFVIDIFGMELEGIMHLENIIFKGFSNFEMTEVSSSVTVVPLGIEFKFTLIWKGEIDYKSKYDLYDIIYKKYDINKPMQGKGDNMNVHFKGLGYQVTAHKILGGDMDYMKISPLIDNFYVNFDEIMLGGQDMKPTLAAKYNPKFIKDVIDYNKLANYIKDFFNESLYPSRTTRAINNKLLQKLSKCIKDFFPE